MNDSFSRLALHCDHMEKVSLLETRCSYHELKCKVTYKPYDKEKYLNINITDKRFLHIDSILTKENFDPQIGYIHNFIDAWIINHE